MPFIYTELYKLICAQLVSDPVLLSKQTIRGRPPSRYYMTLSCYGKSVSDVVALGFVNIYPKPIRQTYCVNLPVGIQVKTIALFARTILHYGFLKTLM